MRAGRCSEVMRKRYIFQWHWTSFTYIKFRNAISDPSSNAMLSIAMGRVSFMVCTFEICNISNSSVPKTQWSTQKASISSKPFLNVNYVIWFDIGFRIIILTSRSNIWHRLLFKISNVDHNHLHWRFVYERVVLVWNKDMLASMLSYSFYFFLVLHILSLTTE